MNAKQKKTLDDSMSSLKRFVHDIENERGRKQDELVTALCEAVNALALVVEAIAHRELAK